MQRKTLLEEINSPKDMKKLNFPQMEQLCGEIRNKLIHTVSKTGGHLASNLGTVELTVALHRVFSSPVDQIVWDVGHQAYAHKLLTGRRDRFNTLRQEDGISGFPKSAESKHDIFLAGHSSTSLSVATGLARAKTLSGKPGHVIAVIGDGAFTNGMVYEAMNNLGRYGDRLIVVLNDNEMSISKNGSTVARYLAKIRSKREYFDTKDRIEKSLKAIPVVGETLRKAVSASKAAIKDMLYNSNWFEDFGFIYLGPVSGHDIRSLCAVMQRARSLKRPVLVHVETQKGRGYLYAEQNPGAFHGVSQFDIETGSPDVAPQDSFSTVFGDELTELAKTDSTICAITAAMKYGTGLPGFASAYPSRFYDIGIAEGHGVTFAAGLARNGMKPVYAVYSTFLQRGYDQLLHDTAIERQHVVFAVDRAGIVGEDGETHQGLFDAAYLTTIPGFTIYSPTTYDELRLFLRKALYECTGPVAVRLPRGKAPELPPEFATDQDYVLVSGARKEKVLLVSYGKEFEHVRQAAALLAQRGFAVALLKLNCINPIGEDCIVAASAFKNIFFAEEGILQGGIAEHFGQRLWQSGYKGRYAVRAVDGVFVPQATVDSSLRKLGLDAQSLADEAEERFFHKAEKPAK